ncbi:DUF4153 domain-containing protein [Massilia sp. CCM 8733]|uniref:DUF4153 domain-containing protein n=1 Tax=Massilia mucilaginosa TaxID=2609282 RepID=A0ABX0NXX4_9BURK|nr:DUF4153 domain-containing protein [Massilia mucilaginosa]NHZ91526.1 DUF4153 domain-containing protein [Massilia mucilaginosa]
MPTSPAAVPQTSKPIGMARAAIGLAQGLFLYLLFTQNDLFAPLIRSSALLAGALVPVLAISSLGHLRARLLGLWCALAACMLAGIGWHASWRETPVVDAAQRVSGWPGTLPLVFFFCVVILFIGHSLVLAAAQDRRRLASYATHFDIAWKLFIQLVFSAFFTGALQLAMWLGATLFELVKISFLSELMKSPLFVSPLLCCAFACALHLTDVRPAIVHGIRNLLLVLMSWLLPVATLLIGGFVLCLPFTGLDALWATRHATLALLAADALLVVLINAAWQNGAVGDSVARLVRLAARIACVLLLPLTAIATYALALRVGDHGWTSDRIFAAAALLVAGFYAFGYLWAALGTGVWLRRMAPVNLATAYAAIAVLTALISPLADPDRIAVNSQIARLASGAVSAEKFDYYFLKSASKRYGAAALLRLKEGKTGPQAALVAERAKITLETPDTGDRFVEQHTVKPVEQLNVWPASARLPDSFPLSNWKRTSDVPDCLTHAKALCDVFVIDFDADGKDELLFIGVQSYTSPAVFAESAAGKWTVIARMHTMTRCPQFAERLKKGDYKLVVPRTRQIEIAGATLQFDATGPGNFTSCAQLTEGYKAAED